MVDGSVNIEVNMDVSKANKDLAKLKKEIQKTETSVNKLGEKKAPLVKQAEELRGKISEARAEVEKFGKQWVNGVIGADTQQAKAQARLVQLQSEYDGVVQKIDKIDEKLIPALYDLDKMKERAGELQQSINDAAESTNNLKTATDSAEKYMEKFTKRIAGLVKRVFIFSIITSALRSLKDWLWKAIKTNDEAVSAVAKLKGALLTLAQPIVNTIIPVFTEFVNLLARIVSEISKVVSILFGTTAEESSEAAKNLYDEMEALEGVGDAAKDSAKALAGFDEINKLTSGNAASGSTDTTETITPDFTGGLLSNLTFSLADILFDWNNLTAEDILAKIVTALGAIAGGLIGFAIGGPAGAAVGIIVGAGLGLTLANALFNGDGKLASEELMKSLVTVLSGIALGALLFTVGGVGGAAIGVTVGAALGIGLTKVLFNGNGEIDSEEILKSLVAVLGAIAGGVVGFALGGPVGAAIGIALGAGLAIELLNLLFDGNGTLSTEEILKSLVSALLAVAGGVLGFVVGGPAGAAMGVIIGAGVSIAVLDGVFNADGEISKDEIANMLVNVLAVLTGGIIGFSVGGPGGALIGAAIGAGISVLLSELEFDALNGSSLAELFLERLKDALYILCGGLIGFAIGGPAGAVIGMAIGAGIKIVLAELGFSSNKDELASKAGSDIVKDVEAGAESEALGFGTWIKTKIVDPFVEKFKSLFGIHSPSTIMKELGIFIMEGLLNGIMEKVGSVIAGVKEVFNGIIDFVKNVFTGDWDSAWDNIAFGFKGVWNGIISTLESAVNLVIKGINYLISQLNKVSFTLPSWVPSIGGKSFGFNIPSVSSVTIPRLATGAVVPPNREFMAVLGDNKTETEVVSPLSTMKQAMIEALRESGGGTGETVVVLELDGREFGRAVYKANKQESRRIGVSLVGV